MIKLILKYAFLLAVYCVIAATALSMVFVRTKPVIERNKASAMMEARKQVMPEAVVFSPKEGSKNVFVAYDAKNKKVGEVFMTGPRGYAGPVDMLVGVDNRRMVIAVKIINQSETPGLGTRVTGLKFLEQFAGKYQNDIAFKTEGGKIDAITGATVSSRAVLKGVKSVFDADAVIHATPKK